MSLGEKSAASVELPSALRTVATVRSVQEAIDAMGAYQGAPEHFVLRIAHDAIAPTTIDGVSVTGMQMSQITDYLLKTKTNWCPKGFADEGAFRLYSYGAWDDV